jgi:hypothetical protein
LTPNGEWGACMKKIVIIGMPEDKKEFFAQLKTENKDFSNLVNSTLGFAFHTMRVAKELVQLWDITMRGRFKDVTPKHLTGADAVIVVSPKGQIDMDGFKSFVPANRIHYYGKSDHPTKFITDLVTISSNQDSNQELRLAPIDPKLLKIDIENDIKKQPTQGGIFNQATKFITNFFTTSPENQPERDTLQIQTKTISEKKTTVGGQLKLFAGTTRQKKLVDSDEMEDVREHSLAFATTRNKML